MLIFLKTLLSLLSLSTLQQFFSMKIVCYISDWKFSSKFILKAYVQYRFKVILLLCWEKPHWSFEMRLQFNIIIALKSLIELWKIYEMTLTDLMKSQSYLQILILSHSFIYFTNIIFIAKDFRQYLSVISKNTWAQIVTSMIVYVSFWKNVKVMSLKVNMRVLDQAAIMTLKKHVYAMQFALWQFKVKNKFTNNDEISIRLSSDIISWLYSIIINCILKLCLSDSNNNKLIDIIYLNLSELHDFFENEQIIYFSNWVILAAKNIEIDIFNDAVLHKFFNEEKLYYSVNESLDDEKTRDDNVSQEYLNFITIFNMSLHLIIFKVKTVIILLWNLNYAEELCNETRLIIVNLNQHIIRSKIVTDKYQGETAFIFQIFLNIITFSDLSFTLCRCQFSVWLAFMMTINKVQS